MPQLNQFQQLAATVALKKLFEGKHFSICDLNSLMELTGAVAPPMRRNEYSSHL
jgi:hypothetical protein